MMTRRAFTTLLAGSVAAPGVSRAQTAAAKTVYYASIGP